MDRKPWAVPVLVSVVLVLSFCTAAETFPASPEDNLFLDREYAPPGAHQLSSWLVAQLRRGDYAPQQQPQQLVAIPYRLANFQRKRNSEMTNSIMGIPRDMINNGKK